ncbi:MAG: acetolactate synthase small subunit [Actinobacteria bacterium]|nr:MAG: acetolactate synthase small subunit [Actinomycetota bacterium]
MKHLLSVFVENKAGVLARVAGLFSRRGFNIDSLAVGQTHDKNFSRMTIVLDAEEHSLEQVTKQLHKLVNVVKISDFKQGEAVNRELVLFKVKANAKNRAHILEVADIFRAKIIDVSKNNVIIEVTGTESKINGIEDLLNQYGILELARTGKVALSRG